MPPSQSKSRSNLYYRLRIPLIVIFVIVCKSLPEFVLDPTGVVVPAPDRLLVHLRQALTLVRATPGRHGHSLTLQDCTEVLVAGDLHGHLANFQVLLRAADLARHPTRCLVFQELIHGKFRYPKGGDKSHQLVDLFAVLKCQFPRQVHYLPGNHELAQWTGRPVLKGDENFNRLFEEGVIEAYGSEFGRSIYAAYLELFPALPVAIRTPNRTIICHSLPSARHLATFAPERLKDDVYQPGDLAPGGSIHSLLWGRDVSSMNVRNFLDKMDADWLISGHVPCPDGFDVPNDRQIILDCAESPASYLLIPTDRPVTQSDLIGCLKTI